MVTMVGISSYETLTALAALLAIRGSSAITRPISCPEYTNYKECKNQDSHIEDNIVNCCLTSSKKSN